MDILIEKGIKSLETTTIQVELDAVPGKVLQDILESELKQLLNFKLIEDWKKKSIVKARKEVKKAVESDWK